MTTAMLAVLPHLAASQLVVCIAPDSGFNMIDVGIDPSSVTSDQHVQGFDVDFRRLVLTQKLQMPYIIRVLDSYGELQVRTRIGDCDVGWAPFYQTARRELCTPDPTKCANWTTSSEPGSGDSSSINWEPYRCCTDFSVPYLNPWGVAVMYTPSSAESAGSFFTAIFTLFIEPFFINFLCFIFIWICIFAHLIWYVEKTNNPTHFPPGYFDGIDDAIWWAAVTVTTVGYGDKVPISPSGRIISLIWMVCGLAMFSVLSGHMAGRFLELGNKEEVRVPPDLRDWRVCGYPTTFDQPWLQGVRVNRVLANSIAECGEMLRTGEVDGVLMDVPIMSY